MVYDFPSRLCTPGTNSSLQQDSEGDQQDRVVLCRPVLSSVCFSTCKNNWQPAHRVFFTVLIGTEYSAIYIFLNIAGKQPSTFLFFFSKWKSASFSMAHQSGLLAHGQHEHSNYRVSRIQATSSIPTGGSFMYAFSTIRDRHLNVRTCTWPTRHNKHNTSQHNSYENSFSCTYMYMYVTR